MTIVCSRCGKRSTGARRLCAYCAAPLEETAPRHLNADAQRALREAETTIFARLYGRKAQKGVEPNDRRFDREVEAKIKRMPPLELDRLLRDDD